MNGLIITLKENNMTECGYTYKAKPLDVIINDLHLCGDITIDLNESFNPNTGVTVSREQKVKDFLDLHRQDVDDGIEADHQRVIKNLKSIPMNSTVRIDVVNLVQRVPNGWIYMRETYDNKISPSLVSITTTFVPE